METEPGEQFLMARKRQYPPLEVYLNSRLVGRLSKQSGGAIQFSYDEIWLNWEQSLPVSLSLPISEESYRGEPVVAVFENLLPDSNRLRRLVAEKVGAKGTDAFSLLSQIGRDCVGALQFVPQGQVETPPVSTLEGEAVSDGEIETILTNLAQAPLGLGNDSEFRISVAGAQEKTALLFHEGQWLKPHGAAPTTHIFKTQIGRLPNGLDLSDSIENEFYCLKLLQAFGLEVNKAEIKTFGKTKALVIERFDRLWTSDGRLLRIPQEDCCQALSVVPTLKYQNEGGPGMVDILKLLKGSDTPAKDQKVFLKAQILFWLIGATDGHAKNFSLFLGPQGTFRLTPLYDVLTAQPSLVQHQIHAKEMKLAMFVGKNRHYKIEYIKGRHFLQTAHLAGLPEVLAEEALAEVNDMASWALEKVESQLPSAFPARIHDAVKVGVRQRLVNL